MSNSVLHMTVFQERKLQCIGGRGSFSPYQITISTGETIGTIGRVMEAQRDASNTRMDEHYSSWLRRRLAGIGLKLRRA